MRLENSLSFKSGSKLNQIVDFRHPEERMAARLVERLGLTPPIDVETLCASLAELSFKRFPIDIDGLCLDLAVSGKKPKVWVSVSIPQVRKRFTIAHEIGHIIIPWHTGTIVDDIEAPRSKEASRYREMEAEANRFAAELLMPSAWVIGLSERAVDSAGLMHSIREIAQVSYPAAFLKAGRLGRPGFIGAQVEDGIVVRSLKTPETYSKPVQHGLPIDQVNMPAASEPKILRSPNADYYWWKIRDALIDPGKALPSWRAILDEMLEDIPPEFRHKARASVNAIVGLAIGREPKGGSLERIYRLGMEEAQNREGADVWVRRILSHDKFADYVLARARERSEAA